MCRYHLKLRSLAIVMIGLGLLAAAGLEVWAVARAQGPNPQPIAVGFSSSSYTVGEGDGTVTLTVTLSEASSGTVTVDYSTSDVTAVSEPSDAADYVMSVGQLVFQPGQTSKTIVITLIDDTCCEGNETFVVNLANAVGANLGSPSTATVTLLDDDSCP